MDKNIPGAPINGAASATRVRPSLDAAFARRLSRVVNREARDRARACAETSGPEVAAVPDRAKKDH